MDKWLEMKDFPLSLISAAGFVFRDEKVLLIRHAKRGWSFPGGVAEKGEDVLSCLKREIREESGIEAEPRYLVGVYQRLKAKPGYGPLEGYELPPVIVLTFVCDYYGGNETASEESPDVGWFTLSQAKQMISDSFAGKTLEDMLEYDGSVRFRSFEKKEDLCQPDRV